MTAPKYEPQELFVREAPYKYDPRRLLRQQMIMSIRLSDPHNLAAKKTTAAEPRRFSTEVTYDRIGLPLPRKPEVKASAIPQPSSRLPSQNVTKSQRIPPSPPKKGLRRSASRIGLSLKQHLQPKMVRPSPSLSSTEIIPQVHGLEIILKALIVSGRMWDVYRAHAPGLNDPYFQVVVKVAHRRHIDAILHEDHMYQDALDELQGVVVPVYGGLFSSGQRETIIQVLEYAGKIAAQGDNIKSILPQDRPFVLQQYEILRGERIAHRNVEPQHILFSRTCFDHPIQIIGWERGRNFGRQRTQEDEDLGEYTDEEEDDVWYPKHKQAVELRRNIILRDEWEEIRYDLGLAPEHPFCTEFTGLEV